MKKILRENNNGIIQLTVVDERFYIDTRSETPKFIPSITWIAGKYPKGVQFYKWLAEHGWDESQAIKQAAGDKGSKVHLAIVDLIDGKEVKMDSKYINPSTGFEEELTVEEYECLMGFSNWFKEVKPEVIAREIVVIDKDNYFAGTVDLICEINKEYWIIDNKTGQYIWPEHELQVSAYKHAYPGVPIIKAHAGKSIRSLKKIDKIGILQIGYKRNKVRYKLTEVVDKFGLFMSAYSIWQNEHGDEQPSKRDYPESLRLVA